MYTGKHTQTHTYTHTVAKALTHDGTLVTLKGLHDDALDLGLGLAKKLLASMRQHFLLCALNLDLCHAGHADGHAH